MKSLFYAAVLFCSVLMSQSVFSQAGVLDPGDSDVIFTDQTVPAPPYNQISKWGHTVRLTWNPYSYGYKSYIFRGMAFRLKFPKSYQPGVNDGKKYPLYLFLHGLGEWADIHDNEQQLVHGGQTHAQHVDNGDFDGFLLYPQSSSGWLTPYETTVLALLDSMVKYVKVDQDRIIIGGLSSGGQATWQYVTDHPERWAATTPISAKNTEYNDLSWVPSVLSIPAWVANGGQDHAPTPDQITAIVDAYNALGGDIKQSFYPTLGHGVWNNFWAEPGYFQYLAVAHKAEPVVKFGRTEFCPGDSVRAVMILQPGFYQYEWQKDGVDIPGGTLDSLVITSFGSYRARFKRTSTSDWSDWSPQPIVISLKGATITPPIQVDGLHSKVLPAPDGSTTVPLFVPQGYASYDWRDIANNDLVSSTNTYSAAVGSYKVKVTEQYGCSSSYSDPFNVVNAAGSNAPDKATSATAVTLGKSSIDLYWSENPNPKYNETGFEIYRSTVSGANYALVGIVPADTLQFIDQGLMPNVKYFYVVRAVNDNGAAPLSNEASATTLVDNTPPTSPLGLSVVSVSRHSVSLEWGESSDDVGIKDYELYINGQKAYTTTDNSFTVNNLDSFTTYAFYVKAVDVAGNVSVPSNQVVGFTKTKGLDYAVYQGTWTVLPNFSALTPDYTGHSNNVDLGVSPYSINYGMLWQGWIYIPKTGTYTFYIDSDDGSALYLDNWYGAGVTPSISNDGLHSIKSVSKNFSLTQGMHKIGLTYFQAGGGATMILSWKNSNAGFSNKTAIPDLYFEDSNSAPSNIPAMPSNLFATAQSYNRVNLNWSDNSNNETGFEVYRKGPGDPTFRMISLIGANATSYSDTTTTGNTTYAYALQSVNLNGSSGFNPNDMSGVAYNYYEGTWDSLPDFSKLTPVSSGYENNFSIGPRLSDDYFAFKFSGTINIPVSGTYTFYTKSDDGSKLYIDNFNSAGQVVNNNFLQGATERSGTITLTAGPHPIYVTYFEKTGDQVLTVSWAGPGIPKQLIPDSVLSNKRTVVTTPQPPAIPDAPSNLQVTATSTTTLGISFKDSSNQTGFEIYRSIGNANDFRLFKSITTTDTSIALQDSTLYPNTTAYYKVRAAGVSGFSDYSIIASAKTLNTDPVITQLGTRSIYYAGTSYIPVSAVDTDGDSLIFSFTNLPSFGQFTNTVNGKGNLVFTTQTTNAGSYSILVKVNDGNGGLDSTLLTLLVTSNRPPVVGRIQSLTLNEGSVAVRNITAVDPDRFTKIRYEISGAPSFISQRSTPGSISVIASPGYADAGVYNFWVIARDGNGGVDSSQMVVTVINVAPPTQRIYVNILNAGSTPVPVSPWNNMTSVSMNNLTDDKGISTNIGLTFNTTSWNTSALGGGTGNDGGIYPDAVIRDNYYFGNFGIPDTIPFTVSGLVPSGLYNLKLFSASTYSQGSTVFQTNGQTQSVNAYNNVQSVAGFNQIPADSTGNIHLKMYKTPGTTIGYLNALVIEKPFDDGTKPVAPRNFSAISLPNGNVFLQWTDIAYNEDGYMILRSDSENGSYSVLNPGQQNIDSTTYVDSSTFGNTLYYYKIVAINRYGLSDTVGTPSVMTYNKLPEMQSINDAFVKENTNTSINVNATDDPGETISLSVYSLPSFATMQITGNGKATIQIDPKSGDEGFYKNIVMKATDQYGGVVSKSFSIVVSPDQLRTVLINFGPTTGTPEPAPWNNYLNYPAGGYTISNLTDEQNNNTGFNFKFTTQLNGYAQSGMMDGGDGIYPDNVMKSSVSISTGSTYNMQIGGLDPSKKYNVVFFSSLNSGDGDTATFTSGGQSVSINGSYNTKRTVQLNGLGPTSGGTIDVSFSKPSTSTYFFLNAISIQEYTGNPILRAGNLYALPNLSTSSVKLVWSDRSSNESGFEIWRSTGRNGTYSLVTTTASNVTQYIDSSASLVPGKNYYYKVRTKSGTGYSDFSNISRIGLASNFVELNLNADAIYNQPLPWNNTNNGSSGAGFTLSNLVNTNLLNTGITFAITQTFNGRGYAGMGIPGILPYNVMYSNYWTDAGQVSSAEFINLDQRKTYRIGIFNSVDKSSGIYDGIYTVNGITKSIDGRLNSTKIIYMDNVKPDENGAINISVIPDPYASYTFTSAFILEGYDTPAEDSSGSVSIVRTGVHANAVSLIPEATVAAVQNVPQALHLSAYPNPFVNHLIAEIDIPVGVPKITLSLFDVESRLIWKQDVQGIPGKRIVEIPVSGKLAPGLYMLKMDDGINIRTLKLVKTN